MRLRVQTRDEFEQRVAELRRAFNAERSDAARERMVRGVAALAAPCGGEVPA